MYVFCSYGETNYMTRRTVFFVGIVALLYALPFIDKPVHLDDWVYLTGAQRVYDSPSSALKGQVGFFGQMIPFAMSTHPPLLFLYQACVRFIADTADPAVLHLFYLPFVLMAVISIFFLFRRFLPDRFKNSKGCVYFSLLFIATPACMATSHSLMADFPTLALCMAALAYYVYGVDEGNKKFLLLAALFSAAAAWASYQGIFIVVLFFVYTVLNKKKMRVFLAVSIVPIFALCAWCIYVWIVAKQFHLMNALLWGGLRYPDFFTKMADTSIGFLCVIGGVFIFPFSLLFIFRKPVGHIPAYGTLCLLTAYLWLTRIGDYSLYQKCMFTAFFSAGFMSVYGVCACCVRALRRSAVSQEALRCKRDRVFMCVWFLSFLIAVIVVLPQGIGRYFLLGFFPLMVIASYEIALWSGLGCCTGAYTRVNSKTAVFLLMTFVGTCILGFFVAAADYRCAQIGKDAAMRLSKRFAGKNIYFTGELGFRYYMEAHNNTYLLNNVERLNAGAIIVEPDTYLKGRISSGLRLTLKQLPGLTYHQTLPVVVMSRLNRADFYSSSNGYGFLPYSIGFLKEKSVFNVYMCTGNDNYRIVPQTACTDMPDTSIRIVDDLYLMGFNNDTQVIAQGGNVHMSCTWLMEKKFNTELCTWVLLENRYARVLLMHSWWGKRLFVSGSKRILLHEPFDIIGVPPDIFPGRYAVYTGVAPMRMRQVSAHDFDFVSLPHHMPGTAVIRPTARNASLAGLGTKGYKPCYFKPVGFEKAFSLTAGNEIVLPVASGNPVSSLYVISFLAYGHALDNGKEVSKISVFDRQGKQYDFIVRAGVETADWSIESPEYAKGIYKHSKAKIHSRWPVYNKNTFFWGYRYAAKFLFKKSIVPAKIVITYIGDEGVWVVDYCALGK